MWVHFEPVPDGTEKVYVFPDGHLYEKGDPYSASLLVSPMGDPTGSVLLHAGTGTLTRLDMLKVAGALRDRGVRFAYLDRAPHKGRPPLGEFVGLTPAGLRRWRIQLERTGGGAPALA